MNDQLRSDNEEGTTLVEESKAIGTSVEIPINDEEYDSDSSDASYDSLFDQDGVDGQDAEIPPVALDVAPPIPGLFFEPDVRIPEELADSVTKFCRETYFTNPGANQVMLFGRFPEADDQEDASASAEQAVETSTSDFPPVLISLLDHLSSALRPVLPDETHELLFPLVPTQARQAIINLYEPGEGITPHVDLLGRYDDGIIGVSFGSGAVMRFDKVDDDLGSLEDSDEDEDGDGVERKRWDLYLPERSVLVLSEEARYDWTHGIDKRTRDYVCDATDGGKWIARSPRISVTFRWMLEGADLLT